MLAKALPIVRADAWYHATNRGLDGSILFPTPSEAAAFVTALGRIAERFAVEIHSYCAMGNHYHLLARAHEEELQRVRSESTSEVMNRLTNVLLGLDFSADSKIAPVPTQAELPADDTAVKEESAEAAPQEPAVEEPVEEEEEISFDEPWIDSIFCTTCDDCLALNKQMFVYNDNRQAIITDPKVGTYQQLVEAAELCPARCIHPGKPLDPDEPGLDDLIKRAEPFN